MFIYIYINKYILLLVHLVSIRVLSYIAYIIIKIYIRITLQDYRTEYGLDIFLSTRNIH